MLATALMMVTEPELLGWSLKSLKQGRKDRNPAAPRRVVAYPQQATDNINIEVAAQALQNKWLSHARYAYACDLVFSLGLLAS